MPHYRVTISRTEYYCRDFVLEADTDDEARDEAYSQADDLENWDDGYSDSEHNVLESEEVDENGDSIPYQRRMGPATLLDELTVSPEPTPVYLQL
jgi:hypothetical protein